MTALTVEAPRPFQGGVIRRIPTAAAANPFAGSAISLNTAGYAVELVAGQPFAGFCVSTIQTKDAGAAAGDRYVEVISGLFTAILAVSGAAIDDASHMRNVYASDDNVFTFTATGNTLIGRVIGLESSGVAIVLCDTSGLQRCGIGHGKIYSLSAAATLTTEHLGAVIFADTQAGAFTLTLPPAADCTGRSMTFIRSGTGVNAATLDGNAAETIDGSATLTSLDAIRDTVTIHSDGSNWFVLSARV